VNRILCVTFAALVLLAAGCNRGGGGQNEAAVRQAVIDYLNQRSDLNMSQMTVDVTSVSFRENEADATVSIRLKGGSAEQGMGMRYTLERKGDRWEVKGKSGTGGAPAHGSEMEGMPGGPGSGGMPPGHPPMGGQPPKQGEPKK
jgi:hypothetical protein